MRKEQIQLDKKSRNGPTHGDQRASTSAQVGHSGDPGFMTHTEIHRASYAANAPMREATKASDAGGLN